MNHVNRSLVEPARLLRISAVLVFAACLALAVGAWILLSQLNHQWQELVDTTDGGLERVEGVLAATTDLASETADGLESVDGAVEAGGSLTDQTSDVVTSVQEVLLPLIGNVDSFAASLEDLALFVERNDALALFGLQPSLNSEELADLRRDLAQLETDLAQLAVDEELATDVAGVSTSLDAVVVELRLTEAELARSADRVAVARQDLDLMRDDMTSVIWWSRGLLLMFLLTMMLSQVALYLLGRALLDGYPAVGPVTAVDATPTDVIPTDATPVEQAPEPAVPVAELPVADRR